MYLHVSVQGFLTKHVSLKSLPERLGKPGCMFHQASHYGRQDYVNGGQSLLFQLSVLLKTIIATPLLARWGNSSQHAETRLSMVLPSASEYPAQWRHS